MATNLKSLVATAKKHKAATAIGAVVIVGAVFFARMRGGTADGQSGEGGATVSSGDGLTAPTPYDGGGGGSSSGSSGGGIDDTDTGSDGGTGDEEPADTGGLFDVIAGLTTSLGDIDADIQDLSTAQTGTTKTLKTLTKTDKSNTKAVKTNTKATRRNTKALHTKAAGTAKKKTTTAAKKVAPPKKKTTKPATKKGKLVPIGNVTSGGKGPTASQAQLAPVKSGGTFKAPSQIHNAKPVAIKAPAKAAATKAKAAAPAKPKPAGTPAKAQQKTGKTLKSK